MSSAVLDSSAILAFVLREPGAEQLMKYLPGAMISTVNLAEVFSKATEKGLTLDGLKWAMRSVQLKVMPFFEEDALVVGALREATRTLGLSLGDRVCLALGIAQGLRVVTAERAWLKANVDVEIVLIR